MITRIAISVITLAALGGVALANYSSHGVVTEPPAILAPSQLQTQRSPLIVIAASCAGNCINAHKKCRKSCLKGSMGLNCRENCNSAKAQCQRNCKK